MGIRYLSRKIDILVCKDERWYYCFSDPEEVRAAGGRRALHPAEQGDPGPGHQPGRTQGPAPDGRHGGRAQSRRQRLQRRKHAGELRVAEAEPNLDGSVSL